MIKRTARIETGIWCREGEKRFLPLLHGGEKKLGVSTLQAAEPPYSANNGPIKQI